MRIWHLALAVLVASLLFHLARSLQTRDGLNLLLDIWILWLLLTLVLLRRQFLNTGTDLHPFRPTSLPRRIVWWFAMAVQSGTVALLLLPFVWTGLLCIVSGLAFAVSRVFPWNPR